MTEENGFELFKKCKVHRLKKKKGVSYALEERGPVN